MSRKTFVWTEIVAGDHSVRVDIGEFTHLRLFHGCRPTAVNSYYTNGIRVLSAAELAERFRGILADFPAARLESAIASCRRELCDERVDTALDLRFLIK